MYESRALWNTWACFALAGEFPYSDRTQQIILDGCRSDTLPVTSFNRSDGDCVSLQLDVL